MRAVIIANGWLNQAVSLSPHDLLIAVDGGAVHCLERNLHPDYVVGDMDSLQPDQIEFLASQGAQFARYPSRKDQTDLELAVDLAASLDADDILILGGLGLRWDQSIANLLLPISRPDLHISLVDASQEIHYLHGGGILELHGEPGDMISLIPLAGTARGVSTQNLEYPLLHEDLVFGATRGVSNVLLASPAVISLTEGILLCTVNHI